MRDSVAETHVLCIHLDMLVPVHSRHHGLSPNHTACLCTGLPTHQTLRALQRRPRAQASDLACDGHVAWTTTKVCTCATGKYKVKNTTYNRRKANPEHVAWRGSFEGPHCFVCTSSGQDVLAVWIKCQAVHFCIVCFMLLYHTCNTDMPEDQRVCLRSKSAFLFCVMMWNKH